MANLIGGLTRAIGGMFEAGRNRKAARRANREQLDLIKSLDWTPTTTAELAPTYQRSQSPVARSYLESFLLGNNPDAIMPGDPMAADKRRQAQFAQNQMFGTPEERVAQQNAYRAQTPWAVDTKKLEQDRAARETKNEGVLWSQKNKHLASVGLDEKTAAALTDAGVLDHFYPNKRAKENKEVVRYMAENGAYDDLKKVLGLQADPDVLDYYRSEMEGNREGAKQAARRAGAKQTALRDARRATPGLAGGLIQTPLRRS